jgi:hypothetical protein
MNQLLDLVSDYNAVLSEGSYFDIAEVKEEKDFKIGVQYLDISRLCSKTETELTNLIIPGIDFEKEHIQDPWVHTKFKLKAAVLTDVPVRKGYTCTFDRNNEIYSIDGWHPAGLDIRRIQGSNEGIIFKDCLVMGSLKTYITIAPRFLLSSRRLIIPAFGNVFNFSDVRQKGNRYEAYKGRSTICPDTTKPHSNRIQMCTGRVGSLKDASYNNDLAILTHGDTLVCRAPDVSTFDSTSKWMDQGMIFDFLPVFFAEAVNNGMKHCKLRLIQDLAIHNVLMMFIVQEYDTLANKRSSLMWYVYDNVYKFLQSSEDPGAAALIAAVHKFQTRVPDKDWVKASIELSNTPGYLELSDYIFKLYSRLLSAAVHLNI